MCSRVIDAVSQKSIYVSEYCPKMQFCKEGTHVMCMFYDKEKVMGPHCLNSANVSITPVLASKLLEISNAIRSKVALGKEKGRGGAPLPRGYGMLRLQWDEELATFAQVLANQCVLRHDICRATKTFPDPGQTAGLVRYTYPDWNSISRAPPNGEESVPGLNEDKLIYAIKQSTKSWYIQKTSVTPEMIVRYPDWLQHPAKHAGKLYLEMVTGHATHMGCGISAYTEYTYRNNFAAMNYNSVQVICNFSARPSPGTSVYNTEPPVDAPPGSQCGCPTGYDEDDDCLCNENPNFKPVPKPQEHSCEGKNCIPPVVLLPIIAMEDAPTHKLSRRFNNDTQDQLEGFDIFNDNSDNFDKTPIHVKEAYSHNDFDKTLREARNNLHQPRSLDEHVWNQQNGNSPRNPYTSENRQSVHEGSKHIRTNAKQSSKQSLFSKANKFKLPKMPIKKDVLPRKDFTKVQSLVNSYLNKRKYSKNMSQRDDLDNDSHALHTKISKNISGNYINQTIEPTNEDADKKVMHLLDNLEQEVKHITLDETEKEIVDNKLRKIYGRISNEPRDSISSRKSNGNSYKSKFNDADIEDFLKYENRVNEHLMNDRRRNPSSFLRETLNRRSYKDDNSLNIQKRLVEKETDYDQNLGALRKRSEKPINENEYSNVELKFNNRLNTRNMNALVEYDHTRENRLRDLTNYNMNEDLNRREPDEDRPLRPFQPDRSELPMRPSQPKSRKSAFYMPDRARSVHGF
ncbi:uncharacterized protein [Battus philenor]|uniref:uncharacterized protein n=1 Tax=Battus philenor TaxID=42288 RepID=UPI0035D002D4